MSCYRESSEPEEEVDPEAEVIATLRRRVGRVRAAIHIPCLLGGFLLGAIVNAVLGDWQYEHNGLHVQIHMSSSLIAGTVWCVTSGLSLHFAPRIADFVVRRLLKRWRRTLARDRGLNLAMLKQTTRVLE